MNLTPEERLIRDHYLAKSKLGSGISFETIVLAAAVAAFLYGCFISEDGNAMMFTGFGLSVIASGRYIYSGMAYAPHITSLLQKYEAAISGQIKNPEPITAIDRARKGADHD